MKIHTVLTLHAFRKERLNDKKYGVSDFRSILITLLRSVKTAMVTVVVVVVFFLYKVWYEVRAHGFLIFKFMFDGSLIKLYQEMNLFR